MVKRKYAEEEEEVGRSKKRLQYAAQDRLSALSDELLLRTLSFLPIQTLTTCQRCAAIIRGSRSLLI